MKNILLLATGLLFFGCEKANRTTETETKTTKTTTHKSVEKGAGTEISPQLEGLEDSASRLKVDTINSAKEAQKAK